jgi:uncharacterized protein YecT (DUF1311 family)
MRVIALTLAVLAAGSAARAQDLVYSDAPTQTCVAVAADAQDGARCIGRAMTACIQGTRGGESTAGMSGCADRELAFWDGLLNATYATARKDAAAFDRSNGTTALADALREMQRAWIPYRDARCAYAAAHWGGGTGAGPAYMICLMEATAEQTLLLRFSGPGD